MCFGGILQVCLWFQLSCRDYIWPVLTQYHCCVSKWLFKRRKKITFSFYLLLLRLHSCPRLEEEYLLVCVFQQRQPLSHCQEVTWWNVSCCVYLLTNPQSPFPRSLRDERQGSWRADTHCKHVDWGCTSSSSEIVRKEIHSSWFIRFYNCYNII